MLFSFKKTKKIIFQKKIGEQGLLCCLDGIKFGLNHFFVRLTAFLCDPDAVCTAQNWEC